MLFPIKPEDKMLDEMLDELVATTEISNVSPGAVARSLLEIFNRKLHSAYVFLDIYASMIFLSTSEGTSLDLLGFMLNCHRYGNESDENYRFRISQQVYVAATANETALRLKCLSVDRVREVILTKYTRGSGSFTAHIITDEIETPESVLSQVREVVERNKAEGIRAIVTRPTVVPIDIELSLILRDSDRAVSSSLDIKIKDDLQVYMDELGMGSNLSMQKIVSLALLNEEVFQVFLTSFKINNEQVIVREKYELEWDERPYIRNIKTTITE